jgi:hypothetical protein
LSHESSQTLHNTVIFGRRYVAAIPQTRSTGKERTW